MSEKRTVGIRGATTVAADDAEQIREATRQLLLQMVEANRLELDDIISAIFTVTLDLRSEFPAHAAREIGWTDVPLLCATEIDVPGSLRRCVRVLLHADYHGTRESVSHVYLRGAVGLRGGGARPRDEKA
jgi:chorismate mutase